MLPNFPGEERLDDPSGCRWLLGLVDHNRMDNHEHRLGRIRLRESNLAGGQEDPFRQALDSLDLDAALDLAILPATEIIGEFDDTSST
jgi:hypothetical protein